jgi:hypothetical protein
MAVRLNRRAYTYARTCIKQGRVVRDERDAWSEHQPSTGAENAFLESHGFEDYGRWHLGVDDEKREDVKGRYKFPYGDFKKVHRCGVLTAESRAGQYKYLDIEAAAAKLHSLIDGVNTHPPSRGGVVARRAGAVSSAVSRRSRRSR